MCRVQGTKAQRTEAEEDGVELARHIVNGSRRAEHRRCVNGMPATNHRQDESLPTTTLIPTAKRTTPARRTTRRMTGGVTDGPDALAVDRRINCPAMPLVLNNADAVAVVVFIDDVGIPLLPASASDDHKEDRQCDHPSGVGRGVWDREKEVTVGLGGGGNSGSEEEFSHRKITTVTHAQLLKCCFYFVLVLHIISTVSSC